MLESRSSIGPVSSAMAMPSTKMPVRPESRLAWKAIAPLLAMAGTPNVEKIPLRSKSSCVDSPSPLEIAVPPVGASSSPAKSTVPSSAIPTWPRNTA